MSAKKYPDTLYVVDDGTGADKYLNAAKDASTHAVVGENVRVAVYTFSHYAVISAEVKVL